MTPNERLKKLVRMPLNALGYDIRRLQKDGGRKVFGIGANKTGTTTLRTLFEHYGLSTPNQKQQELQITDVIDKGDYGRLSGFVSQFNAFQDLPFSHGQIYAACDALFPGSKFILTIRDPDAWFESLISFHKKVFKFDDPKALDESFFKDKKRYLRVNYDWEHNRRSLIRVVNGKPAVDWSLLYDEAFYKDQYVRRNEAIVRYFHRRRKDLLVLDVSRERDTSKFVDFLGLENAEPITMPRKNPSRPRSG